MQLDVKWTAKWDKHLKSYYVQTTQYLGVIESGKKYKTKNIYLHKYITDSVGKEHVDHLNHDTLNNTDENLIPKRAGINTQNRLGPNKNNKSGYRNVCWKYNKWVVQLQINGKNTELGHFENVHEAGRYAEKMRQKYYK